MCSVAVWLAVVLLACSSWGRVILDVERASQDAARVSLWATRAHDWLLGSACARTEASSSSSPGDMCRDLVRLPRVNIRVYAAGRDTADDEQVLVTLVGPEGGRALGPHDAVLVLDPYPAASFGHLVLVFFVALRTTEERCGQLQGLRLGKKGDILVHQKWKSFEEGCEGHDFVAFYVYSILPNLEKNVPIS